MSDLTGGEPSPDEAGLTIEELAERFGVSVRAIRFYIAQGLLPGPGSRGKGATYGEEHTVRLGLIRQLIERHMPLAKIQALLEGLSLDEVKTLQEAEEGLTAQLLEAERRQSPRDYVAALLEDARRARGFPPQPPAPDYLAKRSARSASPASPASPAPGASAAQPAAEPGKSPASDTANSIGGNEAWYRWTLAPGVELQVSAQARARFGGLLRAVMRAAREHGSDGHESGGR